MASLPINATQDEIEEELSFVEVLISSLDPGADDYIQRLAELEGNKSELMIRLEGLESGPPPQPGQSQVPSQNQSVMNNMDGSQDTWWQTALDGQPGNSGMQNGNSPYGASYGVQPNSTMKRPLPQSMYLDSPQPSKRATPEPSNVATPASSVDSFELFENPNREVSDRIRRQQLAMESALRRQREANIADEQYARSLSQQQNQPRPSTSASRPGVQTTLNHTGSYQRPPQPQAMPPPQPYGSAESQFPHSNTPSSNFGHQQQPSPMIKPEPGYPQQQQLVQRPRVSEPEVVDLTNSDSDDEDVSEIEPNRFTPSHRVQRPVFNNNPYTGAPAVQPVHAMQRPQQTMPTAYPQPYPNGSQFPNGSQYAGGIQYANGNQYVYGNPSNTMQQRSGWMQQANPLLAGAVNGIRNVAGTLSGSITELGNLINGSSSSRPLRVNDDDDDIVFNGFQQRHPAQRIHAGYDDHDLYNRRYDAIANYDPAKTTEEINALLENIRPDEEMPAHLRVQTPEAMNIRLHKYQELGLTWLQKCEDGSNKGGILADDMGLGKTIQMLSLIVTHKSEDPRFKTTLIVAPVALMRQWQQEIEQKIKPGRHRLSVFVQHGQTKKKSFQDLRMYDIVLTTFGSLAAELKKMEKFRFRRSQYPETRPTASEKCALISEDAQWYRVILDEAQCIKNVNTQTAKAACFLRAKFRFCMTGTPMMNNVDELHSLIKFLRVKPYAEWTKFRNDFTTPLKSSHEHTRTKAMTMLQTLCKAIMLRRTKQSTFEGRPILILPERTTEVNNPEFSEDETTFYKSLENQTQLQFNKYLRAGTVGTSYTAILVLLLRLRQACCHPHLIKDFGVSATADVTPEDLIELAKQLDPQVVLRIKETGGSFECPVCYDAVTNPAIFLPCGHDTCSECFAKIIDPANAIRDGNENANGSKGSCPNCRGEIEAKRITDFDAFKKVHMPELLSQEEQDQMNQTLYKDDEAEEDEEDGDSDTESEDDSDEEVTAKGNLARFVVESGDESEAEEVKEEDEEEEEGEPGPSTKAAKFKGKGKRSKKSKKGKGKRKEGKKQSKAVTLAELKKLATRSAKARKAYIRRLRADWITSAKIEKTLEKLKEIMDDAEGEKVLVFSQWTSLLDLLEVPIDREGWGYRRYDGSMNAKMRGDAVDDFRDHRKDIRIMLVSLKAGNAGLNLNMASQVIILDPFWNPYIEEQAIDRAHRIGQSRAVTVHRMLIQGTVEDRILALQEKKRALISEALDESAGQNIARLGVQELAYLFGVTRNPAQRIDYQPRDRQR